MSRANPNAIKVNRTANFLIYALCGAIAFVTVYPFIYMLSMSISAPEEVVKKSIVLLPKGLSFLSYELIVQNSQMWRAFGNSVLYTAAGTVSNIVMSLLIAYPLAKPKLVARRFFTVFLIVPMYFTGGLIPSFVLMHMLGLYNNIWAIIIPSMASIWNIIIARTFIKSLPYSLQESALVDGASEFRILFRIIVPLSKPIMAVIGLYTAVGIWNDWFSALLYLPNSNLHPLQMFIARLLVFNYSTIDPGSHLKLDSAVMQTGVITQMKYSVVMVTTLPIVIVYPFLQKYFVKGVMVGSLKE